MLFNGAKDTFFIKKKTLNCRGRLLDLSSPKVMGILNLTPDSFFDGGKYVSESAVLSRVEQMITEGSDIIDMGACSTRPGSVEPEEEEEKKRLIPLLDAVARNFPEAILSVDTYRAAIAREAVEAGARIINDISGGTFDEQMFSTVADLKVPYILMHTPGKPAGMQKDPRYDDVLKEVFDFLKSGLLRLREKGVADCIIDPGFGFGKTLEHNYILLRKLEVFGILEAPLVVGLSRKSMINRVLKTTPEKALNGTTVLNTLALINGASVLRVHDVREAVETVLLANEYFRTS
jgi:dihydropteroate synthase